VDTGTDDRSQPDLGVLYQRYAPAIYARCYRLLHSEAAACDTTQETFARLFAHDSSVLIGDKGLHYLYRVSTNVCFNQLREERVRTRAAPILASLTAVPASPERDHVDVCLPSLYSHAATRPAPQSRS
jgi:DNA-directed RNA polymerase specialized sigma24 family protein